MPRPTIIVSRLILMHSSLAYLSPELRTLDSIIQRPLTTLNKMHLPTEILLHIRFHLLHAVTNHLVQRSASTLAQYESSLRDLLCSDCIAYNHFVYGPDIWHWENFTGACECIEMMRSANNSWTFNSPEFFHVDSDPQKFATAMDWLESYLSLESSRLKRHRANQRHSLAIWDVVEEVLRDHGCHILRDASARAISVCGGSGGANSVVIAAAALPSLLEGADEEMTMIDEDSTARRVLYQAKRDLGLFFEHKGDLQVPKPEEAPMSRPLIWSRSHPMASKSPSVDMSLMRTQCLDVLQTIAAVIVAWLSLPLTFATLALTILCFYSKPRSLRIL
jgi:hypothetical protein